MTSNDGLTGVLVDAHHHARVLAAKTFQRLVQDLLLRDRAGLYRGEEHRLRNFAQRAKVLHLRRLPQWLGQGVAKKVARWNFLFKKMKARRRREDRPVHLGLWEKRFNELLWVLRWRQCFRLWRSPPPATGHQTTWRSFQLSRVSPVEVLKHVEP